MTIDEAIEIKLRQFVDPFLAPKGKLAEADRLSIEALKQVQFYRSIPNGKHHNLLPGETKD